MKRIILIATLGLVVTANLTAQNADFAGYLHRYLPSPLAPLPLMGEGPGVKGEGT
jgi:hypothetical protein